jgi:hypothetical protein
LHNLQLFITASLESAGVVKNITFVTCEDEFVLGVVPVLATLQAGS